MEDYTNLDLSHLTSSAQRLAQLPSDERSCIFGLTGGSGIPERRRQLIGWKNCISGQLSNAC